MPGIRFRGSEINVNIQGLAGGNRFRSAHQNFDLFTEGLDDAFLVILGLQNLHQSSRSHPGHQDQQVEFPRFEFVEKMKDFRIAT